MQRKALMPVKLTEKNGVRIGLRYPRILAFDTLGFHPLITSGLLQSFLQLSDQDQLLFCLPRDGAVVTPRWPMKKNS